MHFDAFRYKGEKILIHKAFELKNYIIIRQNITKVTKYKKLKKEHA